MRINLTKFDENNIEHLKGFEYFAFYDGHPYYIVYGDAADFDFSFRELIDNKFDLSPEFLDEPNGCFHKPISRDGDNVKFEICYEYIIGDDASMAATFEVDGKLFIWEQSERTVVMQPDINSIKLISIEES